MKGSVQQVLFYQPSRAEAAVVESLRHIGIHEQPGIAWKIVQKESDLLSLSDSSTLVVSGLPSASRLGEILYSSGTSCFLPLQKFFQASPFLFQKFVPSIAGSVVLAYLPPALRNILRGIFRLFGYLVAEVDSATALEKEIAEGARLVVLSLDLHCDRGSCENREKILTYLKKEKKQKEDFSVNVIKDFEQGSLFNDINSSAKELTNTLLSPEEYIGFIIRYLYLFFIEKVDRKYAESFPALRIFNSTGKKQPLSFAGSMRDARAAFEQMRGTEDLARGRHNSSAELQNVEVKALMLEWLPAYLEFRADREHRGIFTFMSDREESQRSALPSFPSPGIFEGSPVQFR